jgi:hypothetical protein
MRQARLPDSRAATTNGWSRSRGPGNPAEGRDTEGGQRPDHVRLAGAEAVGDREDEDERGKGDEHVEDPHQDRLEPAAAVRGEHPEQPADHQANDLDGGGDLE